MYLLLGADPEFLRLLTGGLRISVPYLFEAMDIKALERRIDGVIVPQDPNEPLWTIEVQAQRDPLIYHRKLTDLGLLGERHPDREVYGLILFLSPAQDPKTEPWHRALRHCPDLPIRRVYLTHVLQELGAADPNHPLLATFLPYLIDNREQLREQAPLAYGRIKQAKLPETARRLCQDVFQSWLLARFQNYTLEEILVMFAELTPLEQTRAYQEIVAKNQPIWLEEGRREGEIKLVMRLIEHRFGALEHQQKARVKQLTLEQVEVLGEALLDFATRAELEHWLESQPFDTANTPRS